MEESTVWRCSAAAARDGITTGCSDFLTRKCKHARQRRYWEKLFSETATESVVALER